MRNTNNPFLQKNDGWMVKRLGELGKIQTGSTPKTSQADNFGDFIPFIKPADFYPDGKLHYNNMGLSEKGLKDSRLIDAGSVLMVCIGATIGKVGFNVKNIAANQQINALTPTPDISSKFLYYQMLTSSFQEAVLDNAGQATLPIINKTKWSNLTIFVPPLPEQKRIVAILDEAFAGIARATANTEKSLANARELFEIYLNNVFIQKGDGWFDTTIGDICKKVEYGSASKSKPTGIIPVLRMGNIQNGKISWDELVYTDNPEEITKYLLQKNDVLFNRTNSAELVGKTAIYKGEKPAIFAGYLIRIYRKEDLIDPDFLNYYLNSLPAKEYGKTVMSRSINQANINGTKLKQYPISLPALDKQKEIVEKLSVLEMETQHLEAIYQKKLTALAKLKQSILQKAFTGELTADTVEQQANL